MSRNTRLIEIYAMERDVALYGYGSTTFRKEIKEAGAEPDECYVVGAKLTDVPDIALEVVLTSGGLKKLPVYRGLGVREVWFYEDGAFHLYELGAEGYARIEASRLVPGLDFALLARLVARGDQHEAVKSFRDALRAR